MQQQSLIQPGLLSVTFRLLSPKQIVDLAAEAKLAAIEWGGDIHVPHGELSTARAVRKMTEDRGLVVSAYGSYFRAGSLLPDNPSITAVLDTAAELGTKTVRVWPGTQGSATATAADRKAVAESLALCCDLAAQRDLIIATEFHGGTLTDDVESCAELLNAVNRSNLRTFWQPPNGIEKSTALAGLKRIRNRLAHVHVFHWWPDDKHRLPLADGADRWQSYLESIIEQSTIDGQPRYASLEFVCADDVDQFKRDAATLHGWLRTLTTPS